VLHIVVDTREQEPFTFGESAQIICRALPAGDYSVVGFEGRIAVERKSLDDFVQTVIHSRARFVRELRALQQHLAACIVVEADMGDVWNGRYKSNARRESVMGAAMAIVCDWGIPVYWCTSRPIACWFTRTWLERQTKRIEDAEVLEGVHANG
jgi:DNA excision repair protein ERCC-4